MQHRQFERSIGLEKLRPSWQTWQNNALADEILENLEHFKKGWPPKTCINFKLVRDLWRVRSVASVHLWFYLTDLNSLHHLGSHPDNSLRVAGNLIEKCDLWKEVYPLFEMQLSVPCKLDECYLEFFARYSDSKNSFTSFWHIIRSFSRICVYVGSFSRLFIWQKVLFWDKLQFCGPVLCHLGRVSSQFYACM